MMPAQLDAWLLFQNVAKHFAKTEIASNVDGTVHRSTFGDFASRAQQLMYALDWLGVAEGERVATLAWNHQRHLEAYFAVPCAGRVLHTLNVRLSAEELAYIIQHADDRVILVDPDLVPILEKVASALGRVKHIVVLGNEVPRSTLRGLISYEELIAREPTIYPRREIPENSPLGLCYTSGTTGRPKGVVYTHRSTFLHSLAVTSMAGCAIGPQDAVLPVVPMFHAHAWGLPHAAVLVGAKLVFAGRTNDPATLVDLLVNERVTVAAGVPTIWLGVIDEIARRGIELPHLRHIICGGAQPPEALIERFHREVGVPIVQAWGMTETSPLASVAWPQERMRDWSPERILREVRTKAGLPLPGVAVTIRAEDGRDVAPDDDAMGDLCVRGPWVIDRYASDEGAEQFTADGWFRTGDVAVASPEGYFVIADRTKDLIKSGGEWISSVDMEAAIMAMPAVAEAAVVAIPDAKWQERPLACVVPRPNGAVSLDAVRSHLEKNGFARWQLPDRVEIIDSVPRTSVGKFDKKVLRARFAGV